MSIHKLKIGILTTTISNFGSTGFYNSQDIGLARKLRDNVEFVNIYKLISNKGKRLSEPLFPNVRVNYIPSRNIGVNGILDIKELDTDLDVLIYFSDTQLSLPRINKWCLRNSIKLLPYIGTMKSNSKNPLIRKVNNLISLRNANIYKGLTCIVKTSQVKEELNRMDITKVKVAPVGLDFELLNNKYRDVDVETLKKEWGYKKEDIVISFIGRLDDEKNPLDMIEILDKLCETNENYKLLIVGKGRLREKLDSITLDRNLENRVKIINSISNKDIWQVYRISSFFVNLSRNEIFGMAIMEAMYYECCVVAIKAPGPQYIIEHKKSGYLCENYNEVVDCMLKANTLLGKEAHNRIEKDFNWAKTSEIILNEIQN